MTIVVLSFVGVVGFIAVLCIFSAVMEWMDQHVEDRNG